MNRRMFVSLAVTATVVLASGSSLARADLIWDFNDFPTAQQGLAVGDAVYPTDYGCFGRSDCTGSEIYFFARGDGLNAAISKPIGSITGTFSRPSWQAPGVFTFYSKLTVAGALNWGNTIQGDAHPFLADFSLGFTSAAVDLAQAPDDLGPGLGAYGTFLDMWSGHDGTGTLLARAQAIPGDQYTGTLSLDAPAGTTALSITFGNFLVGSPGCVYEPYGSGLSFPCLYATLGNADNIRITPIPEAATALLFCAGLPPESV